MFLKVNSMLLSPLPRDLLDLVFKFAYNNGIRTVERCFKNIQSVQNSKIRCFFLTEYIWMPKGVLRNPVKSNIFVCFQSLHDLIDFDKWVLLVETLDYRKKTVRAYFKTPNFWKTKYHTAPIETIEYFLCTLNCFTDGDYQSALKPSIKQRLVSLTNPNAGECRGIRCFSVKKRFLFCFYNQKQFSQQKIKMRSGCLSKNAS